MKKTKTIRYKRQEEDDEEEEKGEDEIDAYDKLIEHHPFEY